MSTDLKEATADAFAAGEQLQKEFGQLKSCWWCFLLLGILLALGGTVAIFFPLLSTLFALEALGIILMVGGIATVITAFWAGKWSGVMLQLLVGVLYLVAGYLITEEPLQSAKALTLFMAAFFIVVGVFRSLAAFVIRFPHWGWALLNGVVTFLAGMIIYRNFPESALWVIGLLVGLEMIFHGWTWIMMALAIRSIPEKLA